MFFKNLMVYRLTKPLPVSIEEMEARLADLAFKSCGPQEMTRVGFVPPLGRHGSTFVHSVNVFHMLCLAREEKILPAAVIKTKVQEKVEQIEAEQMRKVSRKEMDEIKDTILTELLPHAFSKVKKTYGYFSGSGLLIVDASTPKAADDFTSCLRMALGSLPVRMLAVKQSTVDSMSSWVSGLWALPEGLEIGDDCILHETCTNGGLVRCKGIDLCTDEVRSHLDAGMRVSRLALSWKEKISFVLDADLTIHGLKFSDVLQEQAAEGVEDAAARFDSDFLIMAAEFLQLIPAVLEAFGGEDEVLLAGAA